jgi:hypothetical protein
MKLSKSEDHLNTQKTEEWKACRTLSKAWPECPDGVVRQSERPDWLFETSEGRIGIEVTELRYTPDGRGLFRQAEESARDKTCRLLRELLTQRDCPPLHVSITFQRYYGLSRGSREDALSKQNPKTIAEQIADVLLRHLPPDGISKRLELYGTEVFTHVQHLYIDRRFEEKEPICSVEEPAAIAALSPELIQRALADKDEKREKGYVDSADEYWLLLHTGYPPTSRYYDFRHAETVETLQQTFETGFDRVFVVDTDHEAAYPLTLRK